MALVLLRSPYFTAHSRLVQAELDAVRHRLASLDEDAVAWQENAAAKDSELTALQGVLGELSYESDAAER